MDRRSEVTKFVTREKTGIEIGPWFQPLAPKREGYNCWSLDVFELETLRQRAKDDPYVLDESIINIEEVDLLGPATSLAELVDLKGNLATFDYILSSHNFEHLPDPIRFLQACSKVLRPGGMLSMAVPDHRTCFDYFRPITTLATWLEAYFTSRDRPSAAQIFEQQTMDARYHKAEEVVASFSLADDPTNVVPLQGLEAGFNFWKACITKPEKDYRDAHCSVFTPASFELLLSDVCYLKLVNLELIEVSGTYNNEFYVHLRNRGEAGTEELTSHEAFHNKRKSILQRVMSETGANSIARFQLESDLKNALTAIEEVKLQRTEASLTVRDLQAQISSLKQELSTVRADANKLEEIEKTLRSVITSRSWRVTAPLRSAAGSVRRFVNRVAPRGS